MIVEGERKLERYDCQQHQRGNPLQGDLENAGKSHLPPLPFERAQPDLTVTLMGRSTRDKINFGADLLPEAQQYQRGAGGQPCVDGIASSSINCADAVTQ
jgi:hypothetical protein